MLLRPNLPIILYTVAFVFTLACEREPEGRAAQGVDSPKIVQVTHLVEGDKHRVGAKGDGKRPDESQTPAPRRERNRGQGENSAQHQERGLPYRRQEEPQRRVVSGLVKCEVIEEGRGDERLGVPEQEGEHQDQGGERTEKMKHEVCT